MLPSRCSQLPISVQNKEILFRCLKCNRGRGGEGTTSRGTFHRLCYMEASNMSLPFPPLPIPSPLNSSASPPIDAAVGVVKRRSRPPSLFPCGRAPLPFPFHPHALRLSPSIRIATARAARYYSLLLATTRYYSATPRCCSPLLAAARHYSLLRAATRCCYKPRSRPMMNTPVCREGLPQKGQKPTPYLRAMSARYCG